MRAAFALWPSEKVMSEATISSDEISVHTHKLSLRNYPHFCSYNNLINSITHALLKK